MPLQSKAHIAVRLAPVAAITFMALAQVFLATRSTEFLLTDVLPDDSFYYFKIAQNISLGEGSTFDGVRETNGYHPLWLLIVTGLHSVFGTGLAGDMAPVHAALLLSVGMNVVAGIVLLSILGRYTNSAFIRAGALFVALLNPFFLYQTINGLETSLSFMLVSIFFLSVLRYQEGSLRTLGGAAVLGVVGGLMTLARLDTALFMAAFLAWILAREGRESYARALVMASVTTALVIPWLAWNYAHFGMIMTSASQTGPMVVRVLTEQDNGVGLLTFLKTEVYHLYWGIVELLERTGITPLILVGCGAAAALFLRGDMRLPRTLRDIRAEHALLAGFFAIWFGNVGVRWMSSHWYFLSIQIFVAVGAAVLLGICFSRIAWKRLAAACFALAVCFLFAVSWETEVRGKGGQQRDMLAMAHYLGETLSPDDEVAVFNAGIIGYFTDGPRIVNVDGLVNNASYEAMRDRRLFSYIRSEGIRYIADWPVSLSYRYKTFLGVPDIFSLLKEVHRTGETDTGRFAGGLTLYTITQ
jgi:hypothetical protein